MTAALLDHLWQSTLFAGVIWLIMPLFRSNSAAVRFWLWFAASVKFLVPLSLFTLAGRHLPALAAPAMPARLISVLQPVAIPFSAGKPVLAMPAAPQLMLLDLAVAAWVLGIAMVVGLWLLHWIQLRVHLSRATDLPVTTVVPVKATRSALEPGLVGIWRPVILLPEGIAERLSPTEMEAVMAHELCHLRRRDNLLAAMHMLVEALFWFHPLVWWLGSRLGEEREHACDESVLAAGNPPLVYAEGILKVCRFYIQSPACASGVSGAALETRVGTILRNSPVNDVESSKGVLLISVATLSAMLPLLAGSMGSGSVSGLASRVATAIATQMVPMPAPAAVRPDVRAPKLSAALRIRRHRVSAPALAPAAEVPDAAALPVMAPPPVVQQDAPAGSDARAPADDSGTIVCRLPQPLPASRFSGPQVCRTKGEWAQLRAQGKDISPDGHSIVDAEGDKRRTQDFLRYCRPLPAAAGATTGNLSTFAQTCF